MNKPPIRPKFIKSCCIDVNTPELRSKLRDLGYKDLRVDEWSRGHTVLETSFPDNYFLSFGPSYLESKEVRSDYIMDCCGNESLFLAVAALRRDSDYMQWFVIDSDMPGFKKGDFVLSGKNEFQIRPPYAHKASLKELANHFNNKNDLTAPRNTSNGGEQNNLSGKHSVELDKMFQFECCWTCHYCIYDIGIRSHICMHTNKLLNHVHQPTSCKNWIFKN